MRILSNPLGPKDVLTICATVLAAAILGRDGRPVRPSRVEARHRDIGRGARGVELHAVKGLLAPRRERVDGRVTLAADLEGVDAPFASTRLPPVGNLPKVPQLLRGADLGWCCRVHIGGSWRGPLA